MMSAKNQSGTKIDFQFGAQLKMNHQPCESEL
jgi:hypothetical protein